MTFEGTRNWKLIKQIVTDPAIYEKLTDDAAPPPQQWEPSQDERAHYILARENGELLGLFAFTEHSTFCWEVHTCLLPIAWGALAKQAAREVAEWIWKNTVCVRIVTEVPESNRHALAFAKASGMKVYGINPKCYMKERELQDVIMLGISRPSPCHLPQ